MKKWLHLIAPKPHERKFPKPTKEKTAILTKDENKSLHGTAAPVTEDQNTSQSLLRMENFTIVMETSNYSAKNITCPTVQCVTSCTKPEASRKELLLAGRLTSPNSPLLNLNHKKNRAHTPYAHLSETRNSS